MTKPNPTKSDVAAAKEIWEINRDALSGWNDDIAAIISRHMAPERELLCELADTEIKAAAPMHIAGLIRRAREWKKGQGL